MDRELDQSFVRRRRIRRTSTGVMALGAAAIFWFYLPSFIRPSLNRDRIRTDVVARGTIEATLQASGEVVPAFEKVLTSPDESRVLRILKQPGETVARGEAILELDTSVAALQVERLQERRDQNENARLQEKLDLDKELGALSSQLETGKLDLEILQYKLEQQKELHSHGVTSDGAYKQAQVEVRKATIELQQLEGRMQTAEAGSASRLEGLDLEARTLDKELLEARGRLQQATTRADREGVLTWVVPEEGTAVSRGEILARIADLGSFRVEATVSDIHSSELLAGQDVRIKTDDQLMDGTLATVFPTIENGVIRFAVDLADPSHKVLRDNLRVDVYVVLSRRDDVLKLRNGPYARTGSLQELFVIRGDRAIRTPARFGMAGREHFEILEGVVAGDEVVISDVRDIRHMEEVRIK